MKKKDNMTACDCSKVKHDTGAHFCRECGTQLKQTCIKCSHTSTDSLKFKFCCMCGTCQQRPANAQEEKGIPLLDQEIQKGKSERMQQLIQNGDLVFSWRPDFDYGCGSTFVDDMQGRKNKYEIREKFFRSSILFTFTIKNQTGFDFLSTFAEENGYPKPMWPHIHFDKIKNQQELKRAKEENDAKLQRLHNYLDNVKRIPKLEPTLDVHKSIYLMGHIKFHPFTQGLDYEILEQDDERLRKIWYDSRIMIDC